MILLEEVNATMAQLKRYWAKIRESGDPKTSPAVDALAEILFMGRQVRLHVLLVAQAVGGPAMRENFASRILVRYTLNAWRMLVPEVSPIPMASEHPGRVQVVTRGRAQETQVLNLSNAEARQWAMSGVHATGNTGPTLTKAPAPAADFITDVRNTSGPEFLPAPAADQDVLANARSRIPPTSIPAADPSEATAVPSANPAPASDPDEAVVGLREAYENHLSDIVASLKALRWARQNDPDFPGPVDKRGAEFLYRVGDLKKWTRNRPRAGTTDPD